LCVANIYSASGDDGAVVTYPASSPNVIAVGGTTITVESSGSQVETGWSGSGGGCSKYSSATAAQKKLSSFVSVGCGSKKGTPDVAALANPSTGVAVYNSYDCTTSNCFVVVGGTSLATPIWAARAAVSGLALSSTTLYASSDVTFRDITSGTSESDDKTSTYSCKRGYDLVTGLGSWNETEATVRAGYLSSASSLSHSKLLLLLSVILYLLL
jgi:hypothetical protein